MTPLFNSNVVCAEENADLGMVYGRPAVKREAIVDSTAAQVSAADTALALKEQRRADKTLTVDTCEEPRIMGDEQKVHASVSCQSWRLRVKPRLQLRLPLTVFATATLGCPSATAWFNMLTAAQVVRCNAGFGQGLRLVVSKGTGHV